MTTSPTYFSDLYQRAVGGLSHLSNTLSCWITREYLVCIMCQEYIHCQTHNLVFLFQDLTAALHKHLNGTGNSSQRKIHCLGVDIDEALISRCEAHTKQHENLQFMCANLMDQNHRSEIINIHLQRHAVDKFTLLACFSVTLWIHLNNGDEGLCEFLRYLSTICDHMLIEPQPWKCYKTAMRRMKRAGCDAFPHFASLSWTHDVDQKIQNFLEKECDMVLVKQYGVTTWSRSVCLYKSNKI